ncbi:MAG: DNA-binding protein [Vicinamibacterales bacterium]
MPHESTPTGLISEVEAATYIGMSVSFLRQCRWGGPAVGTSKRAKTARSGPAFYKYGRAIRYAIADLDAWIAQHRIDARA